MMLSVGITILSSIKLCSLYCDYVEDLLGMFVDHFGALYGPEQVVYNHTCQLIRIVRKSYGFSPILIAYGRTPKIIRIINTQTAEKSKL